MRHRLLLSTALATVLVAAGPILTALPAGAVVPEAAGVQAAVSQAAVSQAALSQAAGAAGQPWASAALPPAQRADALLAQMTPAEKITMMHGGAQCAWGACVDANTRLGIPALRLQDGPAGVADGAGGVTQLPAPVAGAATWDAALMAQYGQVIGNEEWGKGANVVLGPTINIVRDPRWGRAFESLSEDPYLAAQLGAADITGIQSQGPMAQVKHYADYNQETYRNGSQDNVVMADRTQREIYLPAFEAAVRQAHVDSVMCSYASVAGTFACESGQLLQTILEGELGFTGFVTSDWGGTHSTVAAANNGLDQEMNGSDFYGTALTAALAGGQVSQATIDGHVRRILLAMFAAGLFDTAQPGTITTPVTSSAHTAVARQVAQEGSVLLKNTGPVLPIGASVHSIAVIGDDAGANAMTAGNGSAHVNAPYVVTPLQGITSRAGGAATVGYAQGVASPTGELVDSPYLAPSSGTGPGLFGQYYTGTALAGTPVLSRVDPTVNAIWGGAPPAAGLPATGWSAKWTGTLSPPTTGTYQFALNSDDGSRLFINGQQIIDNWFDQPPTTRTGTVNLTAGQPVSIEVDYFQDGGGSQVSLNWQIPNQNLHDPAVALARNANLAMVFVSNAEGEGADLANIDLSGAQNQLVTDVAAANPNTVVVVNSGSAVTMPWAGAVRGIIENWYPGQEDGNAIAGLLFGDVNFSGKLPVTFPQSLADVPANTTAQWPGQNGTVQYSEGLQVGYRWYDAQHRTPLFPFGFGLSYTTFGYANLTVGTPDAAGNVAVGFDLTNTGGRAGTEVAQVYVSQPAGAGEPPRNLRGFQRVTLNPGQTQHVTQTLDPRSFQTWTNNTWTNSAGVNTISVGSSSRDLRLTGTVTIGGGSTVDTQAPTAPGNLRVTGHTSSSVSLAWDAATDNVGVTGYQVLRAGSQAGTSTTASFTVTGLNAGTAYGFSVTAKDAAGNTSPASATVTASTDPAPTGGNLALGRPITATSSNAGFPATSADDGDANSYWEGNNNTFPQSLTVDLGSAQTVNRLVLKVPPAAAWATRTQTLSVLGSSDGATFSTVVGSAGYTFNPGTGNTVPVTVPTSSVRYLRITVTGNTGWPAAQLSEVEVYGTGGGTVPPVNLALGKAFSASGYTQTYTPAAAGDGNVNSYWESANNAFPQWLQVDLGASASVRRVVLSLPSGWGARTQTLSVLGSSDGATFSTLVGSAGYTFDPGSADTVTVTVPATSVRYVRLNITGNTGWPAGQLGEMAVYSS